MPLCRKIDGGVKFQKCDVMNIISQTEWEKHSQAKFDELKKSCEESRAFMLKGMNDIRKDIKGLRNDVKELREAIDKFLPRLLLKMCLCLAYIIIITLLLKKT